MIALTRAFADRADVVIAPTAAMRERLREIGVAARIEVVPSAIDRARFARGTRSRAVRALLGATAPDDRVVLAVARLGREKNLERIIDALAWLEPNVRVALVGDGSHRPALEARVAARGVRDRVRFVGALHPAVVAHAYASADAFAFTSLSETQGLVLMEAQAAGLPIAAVDSAVARESLGERAWFSADDPRGLAAAVGRALTAAGDGRAGSAPAAFAPAAFAPGVAPTAYAARMATVYAEARSRAASAAECRTFGTLVRDHGSIQRDDR
jgi:glycosyltransferase involved in cell wall biosynthesis